MLTKTDFNLASACRHLVSCGERHQVHFVRVRPEWALEWVEHNNYKQQRRLLPGHVPFLAEHMRRGTFRRLTEITFAVLDGRPALVNGQHTLRALHKNGEAFDLEVRLEEVDSEGQMEALYGRFDVGRKRSARDSMGSIGDELNLGEKERDTLAVAVKFLNNGMRYIGGKDSPAQRVEQSDPEFVKQLMREWRHEASAFFLSIAEAPLPNKVLFYRAGVVATALTTLRHQAEAAYVFWHDAAMDDGLRIGDPRKTLNNWLRANSVARARGLQHRAAAACWNAYMKGAALARVYTASAGARRLLGTPVAFSD